MILVGGDENQCALERLFQFTTGIATVPPTGMESVGFNVDFLPDEQYKVLPEATTWTSTLHIPVVHTEYERFKDAMDKAVTEGLQFGMM